MRRIILLLLLCVLPLQFALATSVDARLHAASGHHHDATSHSQEVAAEQAPDAADAEESSPRTHGDCSACHCFHSVAMLDTRADIKRPACVTSTNANGRDADHRNAATERPERPNWSALV